MTTKRRVFLDGNGSSQINVEGLGVYVPATELVDVKQKLGTEIQQLKDQVNAMKVDLEILDNGMPINRIAAKQFDWVERMGWHNKTVLEALALIASEVGEAVNECRGEAPSDCFGTELADIILRVTDLAHWQGIDLAKTIANKMAINEQRGTRGRRI
ncbi:MULTISPECIES: hypothetical protein [unclassified Shewanella]|uniref:hypothetical protein n=1 Tax=Shewanella TaxID=22 RepID=UPI0021D8162D|nr:MULTISPECIES: hypothetical protein [unclassified Shewanella]MCU8044415.1 hypothetical protein [Shewanella sp. SM68]MCU8048497.1 hypothetical protein [Shewanella sp. SM65]